MARAALVVGLCLFFAAVANSSTDASVGSSRRLLQCDKAECFCKGKKDARFENTINADGVDYFMCVGGKTYEGKCPAGLVFNETRDLCDAKPGTPPVPPAPKEEPKEEAPGRRLSEVTTEIVVADEVPQSRQLLQLAGYNGCRVKAYGRGVGTIPDQCPDREKNGLLCYPWCKTGYYGVGPVCWQRCSSDSTDIGAICSRPVQVIGASCNCPWYDVCGMTLSPGCCSCGAGWTRTGCTCNKPDTSYAKDSYGRGAGYPMDCAAGSQNDAGLCYKPCSAGYKSLGPMCWVDSAGTAPNPKFPVRCNINVPSDAYWAATAADCTTIEQAVTKVGAATGGATAACIIVAIGAGIVGTPAAGTAAGAACIAGLTASQLNNIPEYQRLANTPACS